MSLVARACAKAIPSPNPRLAGVCVRCGKPDGAHARSLRDPSYEAQFLREAAKTVEQRHGLPAHGFQAAVERRLEQGQELYGDEFVGRPEGARALEVLEEAWDAAAYAVLDAQARLAVGLDDSRAWHLFEICVHAAAIDAHARQLRGED